jgi:glycosyltransferase involved in cell wall biosynthesis
MVAIFTISLYIFFREGFDIVHAHHPPDTFVFITAFYKLLGKRFVLDHHDLAPELYYARFAGQGNQLVYRILLGLEKLSLRIADYIIATNVSYKEIEMRRGHVPQDKISIVRNGPDLKDLAPVSPVPILEAAGRTIIGYVGITGTQDGVDNLIKALRILIYDLGRKDIYCIIVGSGDALCYLKSLVHQLNIADYFLFTGWIDRPNDVSRYLSAMNICAAPEPSDPYNDRSTALKIMEYMACQKPIVAFNLPEHQFTARSAAVYAQANDLLDYAKKIEILMNDPQRRAKMGKEGRKRIETELSWQFQEKNLLQLYENLGK